MPTPDAFINPTTIFTLSTATMGVVAMAVLFRKAFGIQSVAVPAITSFVVTAVLAYTDET